MNHALHGGIENVLRYLSIHTINCSVTVRNASSHPPVKIVNSKYCQYNLQEVSNYEQGNSIVINHDYLRIVRLF